MVLALLKYLLMKDATGELEEGIRSTFRQEALLRQQREAEKKRPKAWVSADGRPKLSAEEERRRSITDAAYSGHAQDGQHFTVGNT
jgi:hypothetical protein